MISITAQHYVRKRSEMEHLKPKQEQLEQLLPSQLFRRAASESFKDIHILCPQQSTSVHTERNACLK